MDKESACWCPLAQTLMHKGGEVLRQFLQLEILTKIFTNYSRFWMNNVHNPAKINYLAILCNNLNEILKSSQNHNAKILNELLESWTKGCVNENYVMEQIDRLKKWKNDIEKERNLSVTSSVNDILKSWLSQMEQEIQKMLTIDKVTSQWNNTFHVLLQNAQISFLLEIEKNDGYLSTCSQKLKLLSKPATSDFQAPVQKLKEELDSWKGSYLKVLHGFCNECRALVTKWLREALDVPQSYAIVKFLKRFENEIDECDLQADVDLFCDKWDDDLQNVLNRYEKQIQVAVSTEAILSLSQSLSTELEQFSFKERKIRDFFSCFNPPKFPRLLNIEPTQLKNISRTSDLINLDLTVLVTVWKKGNFVHSPLQDRNENPCDWDTSISADILRLRKQRNRIVDHIAQVRNSSNTFESMNELTVLINKIAARCGGKFKMDISSKCSPQKEYELRKEFLTWCIKDILVQLSEGSTEGRKCIDMLQSIQTALEKLASSRQAFTCCGCNKEFSTDHDLNEHMESHKAFTCRSCIKDFSTDYELVEHMEIHQELRCRGCNSAFSTAYPITSHMMSHEEFRCLACDQRFSTRDAIADHMRSHTVEDKALMCRTCNEYFSRKNDLDAHTRTHWAYVSETHKGTYKADESSCTCS